MLKESRKGTRRAPRNPLRDSFSKKEFIRLLDADLGILRDPFWDPCLGTPREGWGAFQTLDSLFNVICQYLGLGIPREVRESLGMHLGILFWKSQRRWGIHQLGNP